MSGLARFISRRGLGLLVAVAIALLAVDAGSVMLTKLSAPDDVKTAGYAAAEVAVKSQSKTRLTAIAALRAAQDDAVSHGITVSDKDFTIYPDGRVTLTGVKTAPTLLLDRVSVLKHFTQVSTTVTVTALPYSGSAETRSQR